MGDRLSVDTYEVLECAKALEIVRQEFDRASDLADGLAEQIGHEKLADELRGFASNWKRHREGFAESVQELADICWAIVEVVEQVDQRLGTAVRGGGQ